MRDLDTLQAAAVPEVPARNADDLDVWTLSREGIMAGTLGAVALALGILLLDTLTGVPLYTPHVLGTALFTRGVGLDTPRSPPARARERGGVHHGPLAGVCSPVGQASRLLRVAAHHPSLGFGLLFLFIGCEGVLLGATMLGAAPIGPTLAWPTVLMGNLLAAAVLGGYLWHCHTPRGRTP